jgi:hypothetical protein
VANLPEWNSAAFGCPERDAFVARSRPRTSLTEVEGAITLSGYSDPTATIEGNVTLILNAAQYAAWRQFVRNDLAGGVRPFTMPLWWFDHYATVRARLLSPYTAQRQNALTYTVQVSIEIERETIT